MGFIIVRMALCTLVHNFDFVAMDSELEFVPKGLFITDKNNIRLKITKRVVVDEED